MSSTSVPYNLMVIVGSAKVAKQVCHPLKLSNGFRKWVEKEDRLCENHVGPSKKEWKLIANNESVFAGGGGGSWYRCMYTCGALCNVKVNQS